MFLMKKNDGLVEAIVDLQEQQVLNIVKKRLEISGDAQSILDDAQEALQTVGNRFEAGDYFIPELMYSGEIMKELNSLLKPYLIGDIRKDRLGDVVLGTVKGDIHDIGKDMVAFMLEINGFTVYDLGVDVNPKGFVSKVQETGSKIVGLSVFLTGCIESVMATVQAFHAADLRKKVRIMIGGNFVTDLVCREVGADDWGRDAGAAVRLARTWMLEER